MPYLGEKLKKVLEILDGVEEYQKKKLGLYWFVIFGLFNVVYGWSLESKKVA